MESVPHIPALRLGRTYESLETSELVDCRGGQKLALISQVNAGIIRRDVAKIGASREKLKAFTCVELIRMCGKAGELFLNGTLPLDDKGETQSPQRYVEQLCATSGLPHTLIRRNMARVHSVLTNMATILRGLTRGLDLSVLDKGIGEQAGSPVSFYPASQCLGLVMPSNSPGVNSLWLPAIPLKIPVVLKPGREEPWTPLRIIQAFIAAGVPTEAFGFYPTDHEGANEILKTCGRALVFGDKSTVDRYANNPAVQVHGPGFSKVIVGADEIEKWPEFLDVIVASILDNSGRSCINASTVLVPSHGAEIAEALAKRLAPIGPLPVADERAQLAGFANAAMADYIDGAIEEGLKTPGAEDVTARHRNAPRRVSFEGGTYLRPTIIRCDSFAHPLANREFLFPFASVVEVPQEKMLEQIGPSLVVTVITRDEKFIAPLLDSSMIERLNLGRIPTTKVSWDQPHEGNLFEFLYKRRAVERAPQS